MLKNNIEMDIKMRCIEKSTTQMQIVGPNGHLCHIRRTV